MSSNTSSDAAMRDAVASHLRTGTQLSDLRREQAELRRRIKNLEQRIEVLERERGIATLRSRVAAALRG